MGESDGFESNLVGLFLPMFRCWAVEGILRCCFSRWCNLRGEKSTSEDRAGQEIGKDEAGAGRRAALCQSLRTEILKSFCFA